MVHGELKGKSANKGHQGGGADSAGGPSPVISAVDETNLVEESDYVNDELCIFRNLNTGEVRYLEPNAPPTSTLTASFLQGEELDPKSVNSRGIKPWRTWWREQERREKGLWDIVQEGDVEEVRKLLSPPQDGSPPVSVNAAAPRGYTALHLAAKTGRQDILEALLESRANPELRTDSKLSPLHIASQRGHVAVLTLLLSVRADAYASTEDGNLPVHLATANGHAQAITMLLQLGEHNQFSIRNEYGQRAQDAAADVATHELYRQLHANGALNCFDASADSYARRTIAFENSVLLRNSRSDVVQKLMQRSGSAASSSEIGVPFGTASQSLPRLPSRSQNSKDLSMSGRSPASRGRSGSFATLRTGESNVEKVDPSSFELVNLLGRGSFGEVYQAVHKKSGETYAMKVLQKTGIMSKNLLRYAKTERNILAYVRHPYIVALHYAFQTPSHLVLVLQFCPRGNLQQLIGREKRLQPELTRLYTAELLLALIHLHERQTVFRDLKPENVVIDGDHHAMLTDFGLSKEGVMGDRGTKSFCGSVAFLAPEIIMRKGHGHTVDIYNLGVLLFDMLTGLPPFYHPDRETLFHNIKHATLVVPSYVTRLPRDLILATMVRDPTKRLGAKLTADIKAHEYFKHFDFEALYRREIPVPNRTAPESDSWRNQGQSSPICRGVPESPFDRGESSGGWRRRSARKREKTWAQGDDPSSVSGWEFSWVPPPRRSVSSSQVVGSPGNGARRTLST